MKALVLSNLPLEGEEVYAAVAEHRRDSGGGDVHVVVPVSLRDHHPWEAARQRLESATSRFQAMGIHATGVLGDSDPYRALQDALELDVYDRIFITTLRKDASRWLRMDLLSRATRLADVPVEHVATASG